VVYNLPKEQRLDYITGLARSGDRESIAALGMRPELLGLDMTRTEWAGFREGLLRQLEPEIAKRLDNPRTAQQRWQTLSKVFMDQYGWKAVTDQKAWGAARAAEQRRVAVEAARS